MFVATKELKVIDRRDKVTLFQSGDEVVGFEKWDLTVQRAHLNLGWVIERKGSATKKAVKPSPQSDETLACDCGKSFRTPKGLKTHKSIAHRG